MFGSSAPRRTSAPTPATSPSPSPTSQPRSGDREAGGGGQRKKATLKALATKVLPPKKGLPVLLPSGSTDTGGREVESVPCSRDTMGHSKQKSGDIDRGLSLNTNIEDSTPTGEGTWSAFGIPATNPGEFSVLNLAFYRRCPRDKDQLRSPCSSTCSPMTSSEMSRATADRYCRDCGCPLTFPRSRLSMPGNGQRRGCLPTSPPVAQDGRSLVNQGGGGGGCKGDGGDAHNMLSRGTSTASVTPVSSRDSPTNSLRVPGRLNSVQQSAGCRTWKICPTPHRRAPVGDRGSAAVSGNSVNTSNSGRSGMKRKNRGNEVSEAAGVPTSVGGGGYCCCPGAGKKRSKRSVHVEPGRGETGNGASFDLQSGGDGGANAANGEGPCAIREEENTIQLHISGEGCTTSEAGGCVADRTEVGDNRAVRSAGEQGRRGTSSLSSTRPSSFPWRAMLGSRPAWAVVIGNVGCSTGISVLMSWQPTYFESFLGVDLADLDLVYQVTCSFRLM